MMERFLAEDVVELFVLEAEAFGVLNAIIVDQPARLRLLQQRLADVGRQYPREAPLAQPDGIKPPAAVPNREP